MLTLLRNGFIQRFAACRSGGLRKPKLSVNNDFASTKPTLN